ncbi:MAG: hypothetical protein J6L59_00205 [Clostridia bacterium]|nr:hypothetical protein [Clostridia bacterium]
MNNWFEKNIYCSKAERYMQKIEKSYFLYKLAIFMEAGGVYASLRVLFISNKEICERLNTSIIVLILFYAFTVIINLYLKRNVYNRLNEENVIEEKNYEAVYGKKELLINFASVVGGILNFIFLLIEFDMITAFEGGLTALSFIYALLTAIWTFKYAGVIVMALINLIIYMII